MNENPNNKKVLTLAALVFITIILAVASIFIALQFRTSEPPADQDPGDDVAGTCPGSDDFNTFDECMVACEAGAEAQGDQAAQDAWRAGCQGGCTNLCEVDEGYQCPNGGNAGGCLVFLCPEGCGTDGQCGGPDDTGVSIYVDPTCGATLDGRCGQIDVMKGSNISVANPGSYCGLKEITCGTPACTPPPPPPVEPTEVVCNQACDGTTTVCAAGLSCDNGVCRNPSCSEDSDCTCDEPPVDEPVCGDSCDPSDPNSCSDGNVCDEDTNTCILEGCTDGTCTADLCAPICGGPCDPTDSTSCPNNHVCDPNSNTCVVEQCLDNPNCTNNGCIIPVTGIFDDEGENYLLIGILFVVAGLVVLKFGSSLKLNFTLPTKSVSNFGEPLSTENRNRRKTAKQRESFEEKFK